jgi:hypothetical protein
MEKDLKEFLTIKELSDYLNMRKSTLYSMVESRDRVAIKALIFKPQR